MPIIVHATGKFYRQFEVFVWLPKVLFSDGELLERMRTCNGEDGNGLQLMSKEIAAEVSTLYSQVKIGMAFRKRNCRCSGSEKKLTTNCDDLEIDRLSSLKDLPNASYVLFKKIKDKPKYSADDKGVSSIFSSKDHVDFMAKADGEVENVREDNEQIKGRDET